MPDQTQTDKIAKGAGFIAALDQSGGSTPKALKLYGVPESAYANEAEMFDLVHAMRCRIVTSPAFDGRRVLGAILFEMTMDRQVEGTDFADYLWQRKQVVPFLKVDKGLAPAADGVQLMKPIGGLDALLARAKAKPHTLNAGLSAIGSMHHMTTDQIRVKTGVQWTNVPYKGSAPALNDLVAGRLQVMFDAWASSGPFVKDGKLRVLAIAGRRREPLLPDVPTFDEAGLADFRAVSWDALFAPKATPVPILDRMHAVVQAALASEQVKRQWAEQGARVELESRADFARFVDQETVRWSAIVKAANIRME